MKILQIGYPKSGNYWLYRIIQTVLETAGVKQKNYIRGHPIYPIAQQWDLSYPEQVDINMMDIMYTGCFSRISSIFRKRIEDPEAYINSNTHVWSHSDYCPTSERIFPMFDKVVYIVRDPRDVALSKADFAFTPYMKKHYPTWHETPAQYLEEEAKTIARNWQRHVEPYLNVANQFDILILFYERLKQDFDQELKLLLDYLGFSFTDDQKEAIGQKVSVDRMREESPQHVRKARHYKWMHGMPPQTATQIVDQAGDLLKKLHYPLHADENRLPVWNSRKSVKADTQVKRY